MGEIATRLVWIVMAATSTAYASYLIAGNALSVNAESSEIPTDIVDFVRPGIHSLSGLVTVPSNCDQLKVNVAQSSPVKFVLQFTTWEEPSIPCPPGMAQRAFTATAFAPAAGIDFTATLDGAPFQIRILQKVAGSAAVHNR